MSRSRVNSCGGISCSRMLWASCFCSSIKWIYQEAKDKTNVKGEILHMHALRYKRRNTRVLKLIRNALQEDGSRKILSPLPQHNINSVAVTCLSWEDTWRTKLPSLSDKCSAHNIQNLLFGDILVAVVISLLSSPINQHQQVNLKDLSPQILPDVSAVKAKYWLAIVWWLFRVTYSLVLHTRNRVVT